MTKIWKIGFALLATTLLASSAFANMAAVTAITKAAKSKTLTKAQKTTMQTKLNLNSTKLKVASNAAGIVPVALFGSEVIDSLANPVFTSPADIPGVPADLAIKSGRNLLTQIGEGKVEGASLKTASSLFTEGSSENPIINYVNNVKKYAESDQAPKTAKDIYAQKGLAGLVEAIADCL